MLKKTFWDAQIHTLMSSFLSFGQALLACVTASKIGMTKSTTSIGNVVQVVVVLANMVEEEVVILKVAKT